MRRDALSSGPNLRALSLSLPLSLSLSPLEFFLLCEYNLSAVVRGLHRQRSPYPRDGGMRGWCMARLVYVASG